MSAANVAIRATVLAVLAVCIVPVGTAHARLLFWPQYGHWWGDHAPSKTEGKPARSAPEPPPARCWPGACAGVRKFRRPPTRPRRYRSWRTWRAEWAAAARPRAARESNQAQPKFARRGRP